MSSTKFRFARTATGSLPGVSLIQQTEDAINELAQKVIDHNLLAEETKEKAALALETATTAQNTAAQALSKSEQAVETATTAQTQATTAVRDAEDAKQSAEDSMLAAQASASNAAASESAAESANDAAQDAAGRAVAAQTSASAAQTNALSARQAAEAAQASADAAQANSLLAQSNAQAAQESAASLAQGVVRYDTDQSLSTSQKTRARTNIGAAPLQDAALTGQTSAQNLTVSGVLEGNLTGTADAASKLSTARSISATGDAAWSADFDGSEDVTSEIVLSSTGVTSGTYGEAIAKTLAFGGSFNVVSLTVDGKGRITSAKSVAMKMPAAPTSVTGNAGTATKLATARTISATGDASWSVSFDGSGNASGTLTLANSGATAGSYGASANAALEAGGTFRVPYVTVDAKGRVTSIKHVTLTLPDAQTSVSGNAATATKLSSARTFAITGGATGSVSSDLSNGASIAVTLKAMTGATSSAAGAIGAVPAPAAGAQGKFLRGDGTWQTPPDNKVSQTASSANGKYPILLKASTSTSTATAGTLFDADVSVNPSTGALCAKTFAGRTESTLWVEGATVGGALLESEDNVDGGEFIPIARYKSSNGTFVLNGHQDGFLISYLTKANVEAGQNTVSESLEFTEAGLLVSTGGFKGALSGNASTATKLATARTFRTNLASTGTASFDGSANVTPGVTGTLGIGNGGTGRTDGKSVGWATARTITVNGNASGSVSIDGTANRTLTLTVNTSADAQGILQAFADFAEENDIS